MTVGRLLGPEGHLRYLVGEHRSTVAVPVTNGPPVASVQAKPGCKTPCKRVRGNAGVTAKSAFIRAVLDYPRN